MEHLGKNMAYIYMKLYPKKELYPIPMIEWKHLRKISVSLMLDNLWSLKLQKFGGSSTGMVDKLWASQLRHYNGIFIGKTLLVSCECKRL